MTAQLLCAGCRLGGGRVTPFCARLSLTPPLKIKQYCFGNFYLEDLSGLLGAFWLPLGASCCPLGTSGDPPWCFRSATWVPPGCLWMSHECPLGCLWCLLGASWVPLGASWVPPGRLQTKIPLPRLLLHVLFLIPPPGLLLLDSLSGNPLPGFLLLVSASRMCVLLDSSCLVLL